MEQSKDMIAVKDLYKIYRVGDSRVRALNGVSFNIPAGQFCAVVGTSGSGKSTLLNMLAGLEKPTKGSIILNGISIEHKNENQLVRFRRENVGFIFQSYDLIGSMTAVENVALPLVFRGVSRQVRQKKALKMLKLVGLYKYRNHLPNQMSGGQQQRVGMARALVSNPKIVFADEPTGNLDSRTSEEMLDLMISVLKERGKTLVMVTHDEHVADRADRKLQIIDGKIVSDTMADVDKNTESEEIKV